MNRRSEITAKVFVGCLPVGVTPCDLRTLFAPYGFMADCEIDSINSYGFVHLEDDDLALKAIAELNNTNFMGSRITVAGGGVTFRRSSGSGHPTRGENNRGVLYTRSDSRSAPSDRIVSYDIYDARYEGRTSPHRDQTSPYRDPTPPYRDGTSPYRDETSPYRDRTSPYRDRTSPYRDRTSPYRPLSPLFRDRSPLYADRTSPNEDRLSPYEARSPQHLDQWAGDFGDQRPYSRRERFPDAPREEFNRRSTSYEYDDRRHLTRDKIIEIDPPEDDPIIPVENMTSAPNNSLYQFKKKKPSGAEMKRRRKARLLAQAKKAAQPGSSDSVVQASRPIPKVYPRRFASQKSKKRGRCPSPDVIPIKRVKRSESFIANRSNKEAASNHLRIAIIDSQHPLGNLSAEQCALTRNRLMEELEKHVDQCIASGTQAATFKGIPHSGEILWITCENEMSLKWLKTTVSSFAPLWEGARLNVVPASERPRLVRASMWIPGKPVEAEVLIRRLDAQNRWANVKKWRLFHCDPRPDLVHPNTFLLFGLGEEEARRIKEKACKVSYMMSSVTLKLKENKASPSLRVTQPTKRENTFNEGWSH